MHIPVFVLGDGDPAARAMAALRQTLDPDWAAIGGRYSGMLIPKAGATSGRVFGDAMPDFEAHMSAHMSALGRALHPEHAEHIENIRMGYRGDRTGVDQVEIDDCDVDATFDAATTAPAVVVDLETAVYHMLPDHANVLEPLPADPDGCDRAFDSAPEGTLLTVVDVHFDAADRFVLDAIQRLMQREPTDAG
jgi:hypothetical protein